MVDVQAQMVAAEADVGTTPENATKTMRDVFTGRQVHPVGYDALLAGRILDFVS